MEIVFKAENFISNKLGLRYINGRIYREKYFEQLSKSIFPPAVFREYETFIQQYPKDDIRKGYENLTLFIEMVHRLKLHESKGKTILDLGSRGGVFPYICNSFGHFATASDLQEVLSKNPNPAMLRLFGVDSIPLRVEPFQPLPEIDQRFDLITGFRTRFHSRYTWETGKDHEDHWGVEEWDYFLSDLARNYTTEKGTIFFMVNRLQEREKGIIIPSHLRQFFLSKGADIRYSLLQFSDLSVFR